jgi:Fe-S cluster assembly iron-binding protein IscA
VLPEVGLFIDKDGGRMIMLYIYLQAMKNKSAHGAVIDYSASTLAKEFCFAHPRQPNCQIGTRGGLS